MAEGVGIVAVAQEAEVDFGQVHIGMRLRAVFKEEGKAISWTSSISNPWHRAIGRGAIVLKSLVPDVASQISLKSHWIDLAGQ
jgi:hypothetical protein